MGKALFDTSGIYIIINELTIKTNQHKGENNEQKLLHYHANLLPK